jgi:hypothetical protein
MGGEIDSLFKICKKTRLMIIADKIKFDKRIEVLSKTFLQYCDYEADKEIEIVYLYYDE